MDKFELMEISAVTVPAQTPALARIRKSQDDDADDFEMPVTKAEYAKVGGDSVDMLTGATAGHQHGISIYSGYEDGYRIVVHYASANPNDQPHDHQIMRMPDGTYVMSENQGHTHAIDSEMLLQLVMAQLLKSVEAAPDDEKDAVAKRVRARVDALDIAQYLPEKGYPASLLKAASVGDRVGNDSNGNNGGSEMPTELEKANDALASALAEVTKLKAVAALSEAHKAFYEKLSGEAASDFLKLNEAARSALIETAKSDTAKKAGGDEVVYTSMDGTVYTKAHDPALVAAIKSAESANKELAKLRAERDLRTFEKRAETELQYLPGTVEVRAAILKAVEGIENENVRTEAVAALKAHNAKMAPGFKTVGTSAEPVHKDGDDRAQANAELDDLARKHAAEKGVNFYDAYEIVSKANPQLLAKAIG